MQTYLQSFDLWDVVENDSEVPPLPPHPTTAQLKSHSEEKAKKFKAKTCLYSSVSEVIFTNIIACDTPKEIWDSLKSEYLGSEKTKLMQVLNLKREFEMQRMKESKGIKEYVNKLITIVNKIRLFGENFPDNRIVKKILVTLPEKYETKISSLEDSKDLSKITVVELINALQAVEQRRAIRDEKTIEGAFIVKTSNKSFSKRVNFPPCGVCKKNNHDEKDCWHKGKPQCFGCQRFGHIQKYCKFKNEQSNFAQEEEETLF
ncbi:hypothetical protein K2173_025211 [Erythroxylum novogranatense]|uniref:CCHC-type domain-containing protein n=1 Tax=Erythroxylum novogranatense TaxID=1862640 RepID=A0AAV8UDA9_9ROSI|nr:hypothetical protein K2173_025211 [Erythroxylum novogranatense]